MANYNTVITNEGAALLASVIANHGTITFTNLKLSENDYTGQEATLTEGTFDGIFANVSVASSIVDITTIKVSATVHGYNFSGDHNLYALGVIGTDGNTTALIAVCTTTNPDVLRDNSSTYAFNINLTVSSTSDITVVGTTAAVIYDIDVVDNLTSPATNKPLSANQGRVLANNLAANENVYGAKNQLPYPYYHTTRTYNDITFTDVGDGTITVSGVASGGVTFYLTSNYTGTPLKQGVYIVNGCPINGGATSYRTMIEVYDAGQTVSTHYDDGEGVEISVADNQSLHLSINVFSGVDLSTPITFKPMIRDARITDPTFTPYAKTNQQLTADKAERSDLATLNLTGSTNSTGSTINAGTFFYLNGQFCKALTNIAANATFTENTNYKKDTVNEAIADLHKNQIASSDIVDISPYSSTSNPFEAPVDGYAALNAQTTPSGISSLTIYGSDMATSSNFTVTLANPAVNYQGTSVFVRKGMHVVCDLLQAGHVAYYFPLS